MFELRRFVARTLSAAALLSTAIAAQSPGTSQEPERHTLRFSYTKNAVSWHLMETEMAMKMKMEQFNQNADYRVSVKMTMHTKVVDVLPNGSAKVERTVKRLQTKINNPMMGEQDYDSDVKDADAGLMADMAVLVGVKLTMEVDPRGQIKNLKIPAELADKLSPNASVEDLEQTFSKEYIVLPEQPVALGEVWKHDSEFPLGNGMAPIAIKYENKLLSLKDGYAVIAQQVIFSDSQELDAPTGGKMKVVGEPSKGQLELNLNTGDAEKTSSVMKINMSGEGIKMDINMQILLQRIDEPKPTGTTVGGKGEKGG